MSDDAKHEGSNLIKHNANQLRVDSPDYLASACACDVPLATVSNTLPSLALGLDNISFGFACLPLDTANIHTLDWTRTNERVITSSADFHVVTDRCFISWYVHEGGL